MDSIPIQGDVANLDKPAKRKLSKNDIDDYIKKGKYTLVSVQLHLVFRYYNRNCYLQLPFEKNSEMRRLNIVMEDMTEEETSWLRCNCGKLLTAGDGGHHALVVFANQDYRE